MKKIICILILLSSFSSKAQIDDDIPEKDAYAPDNPKNIVCSGVKIVLAYNGFKSVANILDFTYNFQNNLKVKNYANFIGASRIITLGIGYERTFKNHLYLDYFNFSLGGLFAETNNWNLSSGGGYVFALGKEGRVLIRPGFSFFYSVIRNSLGSIIDTTHSGFMVNNKNIGSTAIVYYRNSIFGVAPNLNIVFKVNRLSYFLSIGRNEIIYNNESVDFTYKKNTYARANLNNSSSFVGNNGNHYNKNIISIGHYFVSVGIFIKVF